MTSNVRLHSEHIHETLAEVLFILDKTKDITLTTDIFGLKEDSQMANRHMKRCSALLTSRERPTDTAMRYHLIPIRRAIIKQLTNKRYRRGV